MKTRRIIRIISAITAFLLLGYLAVMAVFLKETEKDVACKDLVVKIQNDRENRFVTEADITSALKQAKLDPIGMQMSNINTYKIETELMKNGMIDKVDVYKTPSGTIRIDVSQKTPILRAMSVRGDFYIDSKGGTMPVSRRYIVHVPIANGYIEKELATTDLYKFALFLQENEFWNNQIEQIYVHPDRDIELIPRVGDHRIILGTFDNFEEKLDNLQLFYEQAIPKLGWERYSSINLKFKNQVVCTKK
ncbi:cell division protein FtsQ [Bacteroidia bacterium]|nr:cell division protein FtsQ [Bacteroidia bacterium]GHV05747.1 cell division protein FtsQ [Bacteroidia bacterium]